MLVFSIDPGTNSAGWAVFELPEGHNIRLLAAGVRLFGAAGNDRAGRGRTLPGRHAHRRRMRTRRRRLVHLLGQLGLLPLDAVARRSLFDQDPYEIRARGLTRRLADHELGRAICHIAKRRGLADRQSLNTPPASPDGYFTWGAWLWSRHRGSPLRRLSVRNRLNPSAVIQADLAPPRRALEREFDLLWQVQRSFRGNGLTAETGKQIRKILFGSESRSGADGQKASPPDPLVRVAVNQTCKLIAAMTARFGCPELVVIENFSVSRRMPDIGRRRGGNRGQTAQPGLAGNALKRLALLKRQEDAAGGQAFCPYTGVGLDQALALSSRVQIDHIVPVRRNGSDDPDNLVLCLADANRAKGGRTPFEAFGLHDRWRQILARSSGLPAGNRRRVLSRDVPRSSESQFDRHQRHAMRQIVNWIRRTVERKLPLVRVEMVEPSAVAVARRRFDLPDCSGMAIDGSVKNRLDHRHHAVDAVAAGLSVVAPVPGDAVSLVSFRQIVSILRSNIASARLRHGKSGQIHKQTVYGCGDADNTVIYRKPLLELTGTDFGSIRGRHLRRTLQEIVNGESAASRRRLLAAFAVRSGTRRVRLVRKLASGIQLTDKATGKASRIVQPLANHHMDIVADRTGAWHAFGATTHAVRQPGWRPEWERPGCGFKLVMRLHKSDAVEIDGNLGNRVIRRVVRLGPSAGRVYLADPNAAGNLAARHADTGDPFRWENLSVETMRKRRARAVRIDMLGQYAYRRSNVSP